MTTARHKLRRKPTLQRRFNGEAAAAIREALGITQTRMAADVKISAPFLNNIEIGRRHPRQATIMAIADRLGVSVGAITHTIAVVTDDDDDPAVA